MRDWREGKTKHLVEYGEGRAIVTFPFGMADRVTVEKKCICEFVPTNLFGLLGFVLFFFADSPFFAQFGTGKVWRLTQVLENVIEFVLCMLWFTVTLSEKFSSVCFRVG